MPLAFSKMHGAGNDFVVVDLRGGKSPPSPDTVRAIGDRHTGVGFDQLMSVEDSTRADCAARYRIWNSDGSTAVQCGNGARCVAAWVVRAGIAAPPRFVLDSPSGPIAVECLADGRFALDMGRPRFAPDEVPMQAARAAPSYTTVIAGEALRFGAAAVGNPHAVIEVPDVDRADVARIGPALQASPLFPAGVNVGFAQVVDAGHVRLRVHERGAGETLACGSGACAAVAVLAQQGRVGTHVDVDLPGGRLTIDWPGGDAPVRMAGPAAFVFEGQWLAAD
jgi:diaminopimelate epimerase